jgi:hypothetical protein
MFIQNYIAQFKGNLCFIILKTDDNRFIYFYIQSAYTDLSTVKPRFTYSSLYVLLIYVLFFNVLLNVRTPIRFTYFVVRTRI